MIYEYIGACEDIEWKIKYPFNFVNKIIQIVGLWDTLKLIFTLEQRMISNKANESLCDIYLQEVIQKNIITQEEIKKIYIAEIKNNGTIHNTFNTYSPGSRFESILKSNNMSSSHENKLNEIGANSNSQHIKNINQFGTSKNSKVISDKTIPEKETDFNKLKIVGKIKNLNASTQFVTTLNYPSNKEVLNIYIHEAPTEISNGDEYSKKKNQNDLLEFISQKENLEIDSYQFSNSDPKYPNHIEEIVDSDKLSELDVTSYSIKNGFFNADDFGFFSSNAYSSKLTLSPGIKTDLSQIINSSSMQQMNRSSLVLDLEKRTSNIIHNSNQKYKYQEREKSGKSNTLTFRESMGGFEVHNDFVKSLDNVFDDEIKNWKDNKIIHMEIMQI